jgi:hypothetical protein
MRGGTRTPARFVKWFSNRDKNFRGLQEDQTKYADNVKTLYRGLSKKEMSTKTRRVRNLIWLSAEWDYAVGYNDIVVSFTTKNMLKYGVITWDTGEFRFPEKSLLQEAPEQYKVYKTDSYITPFFTTSTDSSKGNGYCNHLSTTLMFTFKEGADIDEFYEMAKYE